MYVKCLSDYSLDVVGEAQVRGVLYWRDAAVCILARSTLLGIGSRGSSCARAGRQ